MKMRILILSTFLLGVFVLSSADNSCGKNEVYGNCAGCENTCQGPKPSTCVCHPGCKCKNGYTKDEYSNQCIDSWDCPKKAHPSSRESEEQGGWNVFLKPTETKDKHKAEEPAKDSSDSVVNFIDGAINLFIVKPIQVLEDVLGKLGKFTVKLLGDFWNVFVKNPIKAISEGSVKLYNLTVKFLEGFFEWLGNFTKKSLNIFVWQPLKIIYKLLTAAVGWINDVFKKLLEITKKLLGQAYEVFLKKPIEVLIKVFQKLGDASLKIFNWLLEKTKDLLKATYKWLVVEPYKVIKKLIANLKQFLTNLFNSIWKVTKKILAESYNIFVENPIELFEKLFEYLKTKVFPTLYKTFVTNPSRFLKKVASGTWKTTKSVANSSYNEFVKKPIQFLDRLGEKTSKTLSKLGNSVKNDVDKILPSNSKKSKENPHIYENYEPYNPVVVPENSKENSYHSLEDKPYKPKEDSEYWENYPQFQKVPTVNPKNNDKRYSRNSNEYPYSIEDMKSYNPVVFPETDFSPGDVPAGKILLETAKLSQEVNNFVTTEGAALVEMLLKGNQYEKYDSHNSDEKNDSDDEDKNTSLNEEEFKG